MELKLDWGEENDELAAPFTILSVSSSSALRADEAMTPAVACPDAARRRCGRGTLEGGGLSSLSSSSLRL